MQKAYNWEDKEKGRFQLPNQKSRLLTKGNSSLTIAAAGGCSKMAEGLLEVLKKNEMEFPEGENYTEVQKDFRLLGSIMDM